MNTLSLSTKKMIMAVALMAFGIATRYALADVPNIETITAVSIVAGALLGGVWTIMVGLVVVAGSDMLIGNTNILYYTWTAWAVMGVFGLVLRGRTGRTLRRVLEMTGMGVAGNLFFYAWTNFGVWHVGGLYPHTTAGLVESYVMALPFLKNQLLSTLVFVPFIGAASIGAWNKLVAWNGVQQSATHETKAVTR